MGGAMRHRFADGSIVLLAACGLAGCGVVVPNITEVWERDKPPDVAPVTQTKVPAAAQVEFEIKKRIFCDLKEAVQEVNKIPLKAGPPGGKLTVVQKGLIPMNWGAQLSLSLQVDEVSGLNPGATLNQVMPNATSVFGPGNSVTTAQSFNLGFGASLSSTATRVDKFDPFYSVAFLMIPNTKTSVCHPENDPFISHGWQPASSSPFILESDLGIKDWLMGAMMVDDALPSVGAPQASAGGGDGAGGGRAGGGGAGGGGAGGGGGMSKDTVSLELKFVIVSTGNITPTWKLLRVSANSTSPFFNTGRTRTHDLIITLGPASNQTTNTHLASQIGNAVSNANRAIMAPAGQ